MNKALIEHKKTKYFRVGESKTHKKKLNANSWSMRILSTASNLRE